MVSIASTKFWRFTIIAVVAGLLLSGKVLAEPFRLNSGEILSDYSFQAKYSFGSGKGLVLQVSFAEDPPSEEIRLQSMLEILTTQLIPRAVKHEYNRVSVWEERATAKTNNIGGLFSFGGEFIENYDFELGENWEWHQVAGPELDFSDIMVSSLELDEDLGASVTPLVEKYSKTGEKYYEVSLVFEGGSPRESVQKVNELFQKLSGCSSIGGTIKQDSYLARNEAMTLAAQIFPEEPDDRLRYMPAIRLSFGHTNGEIDCDWPIPNRDIAETWDEVYASLSEK